MIAGSSWAGSAVTLPGFQFLLSAEFLSSPNPPWQLSFLICYMELRLYECISTLIISIVFKADVSEHWGLGLGLSLCLHPNHTPFKPWLPCSENEAEGYPAGCVFIQ